MMFRRMLASAALAVSLAGCQTTAQAPTTPSGQAEVTVKAPTSTVKALIVSRAVDSRYNVTKDSDYLLQVEKPTENLAAAVLLGSRYDSTPNERIVFTFAPLGEQVRVIATHSIVTNPGSAFERLTPISSGPGVQRTQSSLDEIKQKAEAMSAPPVASKPSKGKKT